MLRGAKLPAQDFRAKEVSDQDLKKGQSGHCSFLPNNPQHTYTYNPFPLISVNVTIFLFVIQTLILQLPLNPSSYTESVVQVLVLLPQVLGPWSPSPSHLLYLGPSPSILILTRLLRLCLFLWPRVPPIHSAHHSASRQLYHHHGSHNDAKMLLFLQQSLAAQ